MTNPFGDTGEILDLEEAQKLQEHTDYMLNSALRTSAEFRKENEGLRQARNELTDANVKLLERLKKCEAAIAMYRSSHDARERGHNNKQPCRCGACNAARAALEEK